MVKRQLALGIGGQFVKECLVNEALLPSWMTQGNTSASPGIEHVFSHCGKLSLLIVCSLTS